MRMIDADALSKFIDYGHLNNPNEKLYSENDIREMIDMMPTVDAVPVRHGKWIKYTGTGKVQWMCSECSAEEKNPKIANWCYHCGARMDAND